LVDPALRLPVLPLVPRSAVGHDDALPSQALDHGSQERDPPNGDSGLARSRDEEEILEQFYSLYNPMLEHSAVASALKADELVVVHHPLAG
jgi:hypothetical protein